jgi:hypothetical protein
MKTLKGYIRYMRRQPKHMQHVHAFIFAGAITCIIAGFILYTDYGFWHEKYNINDDLIIKEKTSTSTIENESLSEMFSNFWKEAHIQIDDISKTGAGLLEGKETYTR